MNRISLLSMLVTALTVQSKAQNIINGFTAGKGNFNISASYTYESFDELFFGDESRNVSNMLGDFTVNSYSIYGEYGITDRFDVIVTLPYIKTEASNPVDATIEEGFQDLSILGKYAFYRSEGPLNVIDVVGAAGISFPVSDYNPSMPVTIGNHTFTTKLAVAGLSRWHHGLFTEISLGYDIRSENVPNNFNGHFKFGWSSDRFYTHLWYQFLESFNGEILAPGNDLQELDTDTQRVGVLISYVFIPRLSVFSGVGTLLTGENTANTDIFFTVGLSTSLHFLQ